MKKSTQRRVKTILKLLKRKEAYFWEESDYLLCYTYPRGGWIKPATINGESLEYVGAHDDTPVMPTKNNTPLKFPQGGLPVLGYIKNL